MLTEKNDSKGFTLVELLAVIVILAIIMIIAIPSVINTMNTASKKTFMEYASKIYTKSIEQQIINDSFEEIPAQSDDDVIIYNIKTDLGYDTTGDFNGYIVRQMFNHSCGESIWICHDYSEVMYLILWNDDYFLAWNMTADGAPTADRVWESTDSIFNTTYSDNFVNEDTYQSSIINAKVGDDILVERSKFDNYIATTFAGMNLKLDDFTNTENVETMLKYYMDAIYNTPNGSGLLKCRYWSIAFIAGGNSTTDYEVFYKLEERRDSCY